MAPLLAVLVPHVASNEGQAQEVDLVEQSLEAAVFLHPFLDLREQVLGHVGGAGLARFAEGDVVGLVQRAAVMAPARGLAATFVQKNQARGQHGASRGQLIEPTCPACGGPEWGGSVHAWRVPSDIRYWMFYTGKGLKNQGCEEKI